MNRLAVTFAEMTSGPQQSQSMRLMVIAVTAFLAIMAMSPIQATTPAFIDEAQIRAVIDEFAAGNGNGRLDRFDLGVRQAARFWRTEDGSAADFARFCKDNFIADSAELEKTVDRIATAFESIYGHMGETGRDLSWNLDIETGPLLPVDYLLAEYSPYAHFSDDMFKTKMAFLILLNFPQYKLDDLLRLGPSWTPRQWMLARLAGQFETRIPSEVSQYQSKVSTETDDYINRYNFFMHHLLTPDGRRPFPKDMRLVSHWNLRDEIKALYAEPDGLDRQKMIYDLMGRIVRQEVPAAVINNPAVDWTMAANKVAVSTVVDGEVPSDWKSPGKPGTVVDNTPEPNTRYANILKLFHAQQMADPYYPEMPTLVDRIFQDEREIPEDRVEQMFVSVLGSNIAAGVGKLISKRLGRPLQPFDIWYNGFEVRGAISAARLDSLTKAKYPTVASFQADMPNILRKLGFGPPAIELLTSKIVIDPSRGIGHAAGPSRPSDKARLRTRFVADGLDYKGYNIATHEFGHNVEQTFSANRTPYMFMRDVPNTAFTEAFAYVFQTRDLPLLGINDRPTNAEYLDNLAVFWQMYEITGVALVDMRMWHWMYAHPDATPAQLKDAVVGIAKDIWNTFYAPVFGVRDIDLLAVYSHMVYRAMYIPDYSLAHIISFQIEQYLKDKNIGTEMERMCSLGKLTPDLWMERAVGSPISTKPMLQAAEEALQVLSK